MNLLTNSRMPSTRGKHRAAWQSWTRFCRHVKVDRLDVSEHLLVYLVAWMSKDRKLKHGTARQYVSAVLAF